jgi:hypothetical protein
LTLFTHNSKGHEKFFDKRNSSRNARKSGTPNPRQLFSQSGQQKGEGFEYHLLALALTGFLMVRGSGAFSIDQILAEALGEPETEHWYCVNHLEPEKADLSFGVNHAKPGCNVSLKCSKLSKRRFPKSFLDIS